MDEDKIFQTFGNLESLNEVSSDNVNVVSNQTSNVNYKDEAKNNNNCSIANFLKDNQCVKTVDDELINDIKISKYNSKISIEFLTAEDETKKHTKTGVRNIRRQNEKYIPQYDETDSVSSLSADETMNKNINNEKIKRNDELKLNINNIASSERTSITSSIPEVPKWNEDHALNAQQGLTVANDALNKMQESCQVFQLENQILKDQLRELKGKYLFDVSSQNKSIFKADKLIDNVNKKLEWYKEEIDKFQKDLIKSKEEGINIYKSLNEANQAIRELEKEVKHLKNQNEMLQNENFSQISVNNNLKSNIAVLESEKEQLHNNNESMVRQNKNLSKETSYLQNELKSTEDELISSKNEIRKLQTNIKTFDNQIHSLDNNLKSLHEDKSLLLKLNQQTNKNLEECINESACLRHENTKLLDKVRELKTEIQKSNMTMEQIQGHAKIEMNALRRELLTFKQQPTVFQSQIIPNNENISLEVPQDFTFNQEYLRISQEKIELEQQLTSYEKKYRELKKLWVHSFGDKIRKSSSTNKNHKKELDILYNFIGNDEVMTNTNSLADFSTHLENHENRPLLKHVVSLLINDRNEYWNEKLKLKDDEMKRHIKNLNKEIKHLKNNICRAAAQIS